MSALRLNPDARDALMGDWNERVRYLNNNEDPFRYAMWKIIGRLEINKKTIPCVIDTWQDWMWLQLILAREPASQPGQVVMADTASERYTLADVGRLVMLQRQNAEEMLGPLNFFQQLVLTGQFEMVSTAISICPGYR